MNTLTRSQKAAETRKRNAESKARIEAGQAEMRTHVARGTCPDCGAAIKRNLSMTGWYQCSQFGAEGFRADSSKPACNFQGFTE